MDILLYPCGRLPQDAASYYGNAESLGHGFFPIGSNRFWHGGVHLNMQGGAPIRAIAKGRVIAWRLNKKLPEYAPPGHAKGYPFSSGFVLIQHTFDNNRVNGPEDTRNTRSWKYYSLYMHLLHQPELAKKKELPLFLMATRKAITTKTYDVVTPLSLENTNVYRMRKIRHAALGREGWIAQDAIDSKNRLRYPIEYLYEMNPNLGLPEALTLDQIVCCDIAVEADEVIGYGGARAFQGSIPDMVHLEIFTSETSLLEFFENPTRDVLGQVFLDENTELFDKPPADTSRQAKRFPAKQVFYSVSPVDIYGEIANDLLFYKFRVGPQRDSPVYYGSKSVKFHSHADWRKCSWQSLQENGRFSDDGFCDSSTPLFNMLDKNRDMNIDIRELQGAKRILRRMAVKHPTEWSSAHNEAKYRRLKTGEKGLLKLTGESYTKFIEHLEKQQFWEHVPGLPDADAVWHLHPIGFIEHLRLRQCTLTGVTEADFRDQVRATMRQVIDLLEKRQRQLGAWRSAVQASFLKWFGTAGGDARALIALRIEKMLLLVKTRRHEDILRAGFDKDRWIGYGAVFAYVYRDDPDQRIFIGADYHAAPDTGSDSRAGVLIHEMSHFSEVGGTMDYWYGQAECAKLARSNSSEALRNADSFEYFMEDAFDET